MAAPVQQELQDLRLCAHLADYAYVSGKPGVSDAELRSKWPVGYKVPDHKRETFYSDSWYRKPGTQHRFFKSHAYVSLLERTNSTKPEGGTKQIVVGFRGTWLQPGEPSGDVTENTTPAVATPAVANTPKPNIGSKLINLPFSLFAPSNYGLADIYYDLTLIRVPYRTGVVWKWYTYWGTLVLGGSDRFATCNIWSWPRKVAAGAISRPQGNKVADTGNLLVHLGFWALWASPEGFAGYNRAGELWKSPKAYNEPVRMGVLQSVIQKVRDAKGQDIDIFVVGHSLGGAVSCFAALDIIAELEKLGQSDEAFKKVKVIHATFGAPPVGTAAFAAHFAQRTRFHRSYAVIHERDGIPKCFAWFGSKGSSQWRILRWLRWLGWWSDWNRVGKELVMRKLIASKSSQDTGLPDKTVSTMDKAKAGFVGAGAVAFVCIGQVLALPLSLLATPIFWLIDRTSEKKHYGTQANPPGDWKTAGPWADGVDEPSDEDKNLEHVGLEYHSLQKYIGLLEEDDDPFQVASVGAKKII